MLLMIDEVYVAKRIEYSGGSMHGLTSDSNVASTPRCFVTESVASKYRDIITIYPVDELTAVKENDCNIDVMSLLRRTAATVVAISVNNAATNRKLSLWWELSTCTVDVVTGSRSFLFLTQYTPSKTFTIIFKAAKKCPPMDRNLPGGDVMPTSST